MRYPVALIVVGSLLAACSPASLGIIPTTLKSTAADADALGGLPDLYAAHPSVQMSAPKAFVLTSESMPFVTALTRKMDPIRQSLATALASDPTVTQGLASWERSSPATQLNVLKRVAAIEGDVMGCAVPTIVSQSGQADTSGTMAYYQADVGTNGQITLYPDQFARGGKYLAVATVVHEMRHAAQDQLISAGGGDDDLRTLADGYATSWQTIDAVGSEAQLAYGDYVHLTFEFDAFQTGNQVATLLSNGTFDSTGNGFADVRYQSGQTPMMDLVGLMSQYAGRALITAVNTAEYQAERSRGTTIAPRTGPVLRPTQQTTVRNPRRTWR